MPVSWKDLELSKGPTLHRLEHGKAPMMPGKRDPWASFLSSPASLWGLAGLRGSKE